MECCASCNTDCQDLLTMRHTTSGVYHVTPTGTFRGYDVYCDMETDGGGWLVKFDCIADHNASLTKHKRVITEIMYPHRTYEMHGKVCTQQNTKIHQKFNLKYTLQVIISALYC